MSTIALIVQGIIYHLVNLTGLYGAFFLHEIGLM
jgi:hypothetical protein